MNFFISLLKVQQRMGGRVGGAQEGTQERIQEEGRRGRYCCDDVVCCV